jgi:uncharacterized protein YdiU (UPF0061 family)
MESPIATLHWDNRSVRELPVDDEKRNYVRTVRNACFALVEPTPVDNPRLVAYSDDALALMGLRATEDLAASPEFAQYFSGNMVFPGCRTAAHCYCGHQVSRCLVWWCCSCCCY